ncbi:MULTISPECIES: DUF2599 domain-containing protein [Streptomyces]|uniref:DUF2599 domain-containing protein n=1 Tax=Streptomyces TaxID=1883 RepID=UPI001646B823|nr:MULTISPECIES: DUF2599 domain-containing protein [Streptomyces]MBT3078361.1 hypothetical protein [Streptomyces sp. COG21]MBT3087689.1 hypothetical protein [Streptomyces sp. CYG21]MBT3099389.1 hypothetical protein [Streptomyces sp. CBG30]MBT3104005.1 hypothetical protein [Streptomyces sp. COG19]MBT3113411.1 hypothetical protein [Streptomyces sp. CYG20]
MKRGTLLRRIGRGSAICLTATALATLGLTALASPASAAPFCGPSKFVQEIKVADWEGEAFQIILTPTPEARGHAATAINPRDAVVEQWHAIQGCVSGLEGGIADTIWDQLECHQLNSWVPFPREGSNWLTGETYELESWRPVLPRAVPGAALVATECLNRLGEDPAGPLSTYRPDAGRLDLHGAQDNIA